MKDAVYGFCIREKDQASAFRPDQCSFESWICAYLKKQEIIIPTRGSIQDIGPTTSHKTKIVELYLKGYEYTEIERRTRHTGQSIKRYIIGFTKVVMLHSKGYNQNQIRER